MTVQIYYDDDADLGLVQARKVAVIGYGSRVMPTLSICATRASRW